MLPPRDDPYSDPGIYVCFRTAVTTDIPSRGTTNAAALGAAEKWLQDTFPGSVGGNDLLLRITKGTPAHDSSSTATISSTAFENAEAWLQNTFPWSPPEDGVLLLITQGTPAHPAGRSLNPPCPAALKEAEMWLHNTFPGPPPGGCLPLASTKQVQAQHYSTSRFGRNTPFHPLSTSSKLAKRRFRKKHRPDFTTVSATKGFSPEMCDWLRAQPEPIHHDIPGIRWSAEWAVLTNKFNQTFGSYLSFDSIKQKYKELQNTGGKVS